MANLNLECKVMNGFMSELDFIKDNGLDYEYNQFLIQTGKEKNLESASDFLEFKEADELKYIHCEEVIP